MASTTQGASRPIAPEEAELEQHKDEDDPTDNRKLSIEVGPTMRNLLGQEDTDGDKLITVDDNGPKGLQTVVLTVSQLSEDPVQRLTRLIKNKWWSNLTRQMDARGIAAACPDEKNTTSSQPRIYIPLGAPEQYVYYTDIAEKNPAMNLDVQWLPGEITGDYIKSIYPNSGILALEMDYPTQIDPSEKAELIALPFIVPGGRFNELYNWDSYFCAIGMIDSHPYIASSILRHFIFEIKHYGKILNANRSYYLGRAQPPFLTDLALRVYEATKLNPGAKDLLKQGILAAMKEYHTWWMSEPRLDPESGLSRYRPIGKGIPPECEPAQFAHILAPYTRKHKTTLREFIDAYNDGNVEEPELDNFFLHDRAVRESGHDTSNRLEGICADLATVDLNSLLYKYETDIARCIRTVFFDSLLIPASFCAPGQEADHLESSAIWYQRADARKARIDRYCWNDTAGLYYDFNTATKKQQPYDCATTLWPLWAGLASSHQASLLVPSALSRLEYSGGISSSSEASRGAVSPDRPQKQWDFPHAWAPHQLLAWDGLRRYGYTEEAERVCYKWLGMVTKVFTDFNGTVVEKYDVRNGIAPHKIPAEYGNQGLGFEYAPQEGFLPQKKHLSIAADTTLESIRLAKFCSDLDEI
ncbi:MAG: hypothetical protein Q9191_001125 [Dirinaria sp. TL-2023a]